MSTPQVKKMLTITGDSFILYLMFRAYDKGGEQSYTLGVFPTIELIKCRPGDVVAVLIHSKLNISEDISRALALLPPSVPVTADDRAVERLAKKDNTFMLGVFKKRDYPLSKDSQVVLVEPSDIGNLGTIVRTAVGFGYKNIVLVGNAADIFDPRAVRASMGAVMRINIKRYGSFEAYAEENPLPKYLFMLGAEKTLTEITPPDAPVALVFGNESSGLPKYIAGYGTPVVIKHSDEIDSLALPQAVAIGLHYFANTKKH